MTSIGEKVDTLWPLTQIRFGYFLMEPKWFS